MTVRKAYTDGRFGQIHYRVAEAKSEQDKPPLICLHQSPKCGLEFEVFMKVASHDRMVIAPDYPGYGMSDPAPSEAATTIPMYAEEMWRVVDAFKLKQVDLLGNHTGSKVAAAMAMKRGSNVRAIAMISAALLTDEERAMFVDMFTPIPLDEAHTRFTTSWARDVERQGPGQTLEMMDRSMYMNMMGGEAYEWGHVAAFAWNTPYVDALKTLPHRITVLNPVDDLTESTRRAKPIMRNGEIVECPDWGYGFMDAFPDDVADLLLAKLDA